MNVNKRAFTINGLFLWLALCSVYSGTDASLRTMYVEELCYGTFTTTLSLRYQTSGILASVPTEALDCEIKLESVRDSSIVIAFPRYSLAPSDRLVFTDRHNFQLSLSGGATFLDERKSIILEGPVRIHFITNDTYGPNRLKFQLVYTQVHDGPCELDEFQCRNNKCIPSNLACDKHNHCGDINDQGDCKPLKIEKQLKIESLYGSLFELWYRFDLQGPRNEVTFQEDKVIVTNYKNPWIISIIVCGIILAIVVISFGAVVIRRRVENKKKAKQPQQLPTFAGTTNVPRVAPPTVAATTHVPRVTPPTVAATSDIQRAAVPTVAAASDVQTVAPPSVLERIRHSFKRGHQSVPSQKAASPAGHASEHVDVPSMYPQLPSAPEYDGVDNTEFKIDE